MKFLLLSLLIVCTGYCACGASNHFKMTAQQALINAANGRLAADGTISNGVRHSITRRQTSTVRCTEAGVEYQCTSGYGQALVDVAARCGNNEQARGFAAACARNENNEYCVNAGLNTPDIPSSCTFFGSCPSSCRSYLQMIRSTLGCCINSLFNFTDSHPELREALSYSVWSSCGVETIQGSCNNGLDFTPVSGNPVCSDDDLHQQIAQLGCCPPYIDGLRNALRNEGVCSDEIMFEQDACTVNSNGDLCAGEARDDLLAIVEGRLDDVSIGSVVNNCGLATTSFCPSSCRNALITFRRDLGCCADTLYGNPNHPNGVLITEALWDACNVDNPGLCRSSAAMITSTTNFGFVVILMFVLYIM